MRIVAILAAGLVAAAAGSAPGAPVPQPPPIVYAAADNTLDLVVMRSDGSQRRVVAGSVENEHEPSWSPDGARIVFAAYDQDAGRIKVLDLRNGRLRDLGPGSSPDWSPNGAQLVFVDGGQASRDLAVMRSDGTGRRTLGVARDGSLDFPQNPAWSPDGRAIAFDVLGRGIHLVAADGTDVRVLRSDRFSHDPTWAPDGSRIAFTCAGVRSDESVCTIRPNGSGFRRLPLTEGTTPSWSPHGDLIAVSRATPSGTIVVRADGTRVRTLSVPSPRGAGDTMPDWSPDGTSIVVAHYVGDGTGLYATDASAGRIVQLTRFEAAQDRSPAWSPDGRQIAFRRHVGGRCTLAVLDVARGTVRTLVPEAPQGTFCEGRPDWSRDGSRVVYSSRGDLWTVRSSGGEPQRLTATRVSELSPRWAPDGRSIGFVAPDGIRLLRPDGRRTLLVPGGGPFAWSHGGTMLAYVGREFGVDEVVLAVRIAGGTPRILYDEGVVGAPSWSPRDTTIAFTRSGPRDTATTLMTIDLTGRATLLRVYPLQPDWRP